MHKICGLRNFNSNWQNCLTILFRFKYFCQSCFDKWSKLEPVLLDSDLDLIFHSSCNIELIWIRKEIGKSFQGWPNNILHLFFSFFKLTKGQHFAFWSAFCWLMLAHKRSRQLEQEMRDILSRKMWTKSNDGNSILRNFLLER